MLRNELTCIIIIWSSEYKNTWFGNWGVFRTATDMQNYGSLVKPICLIAPTTGVADLSKAYFAGWGTQDKSGELLLQTHLAVYRLLT
jgi:hypothetical protein